MGFCQSRAASDLGAPSREPTGAKPRKWRPRPFRGLARIGTATDEVLLVTKPPQKESELSSGQTVEQRLVLSVFDEMDRVSRLRLYGVIPEDVEQKLVETPAPSLQHFGLSGVLTPGKSRARDPMPLLFAGQHPKLTSLAIAFFSQFGENNFTDLRKLILLRQNFTSAGMLSTAKLLSSCTDLQDLTLTQVSLQSDAFDPTLTPSEVHLPRLRHLRFNGTAVDHVIKLLHWLRVDGSQPLALSIEAFGKQKAWHEPIQRISDVLKVDPYGILGRTTQLQVTMVPHIGSAQPECSLVFAGPEHLLSFLRFAAPDWGKLSTVLRVPMAASHIDDLWIDCSKVGNSDASDARGESLQQLLAVSPKIHRLFTSFTPQLWGALESTCPELTDLHVKLPRLPSDTEDVGLAYAWSLLKGALEKRAAQKFAEISHLHFYSPHYASEDDARLISLHQEWQTQVQQEKLPHVAEVTVHPVVGPDAKGSVPFPAMKLPQIPKMLNAGAEVEKADEEGSSQQATTGPVSS